jgi:aminomethyltransferase
MNGAETAERVAAYRGGLTVSAYSDARAEFAALRGGCAVYDLSWRAKINLGGNDRVRWLNGMLTNNIRDLAVDRGVYAFLLNPQGHILGDLYAYNRGDYLLVETDQEQAEKVLGIFKRYIIMDKVELSNVSDKLTAIGVSGSACGETLRKLGVEFPDLKPLELVDTTWRQVSMTVVRGDNPISESYEISLAPESVKTLWNALVQSGATPVGSEALELLRIASGVPRYGQDIRERDLPQETEQTRGLNFTKGCYIGQEIVERIRSRGNVHRKFTGYVLHGSLPALGTKVRADGKDVGEITSTAFLPMDGGDLKVALGYVRREIGTDGKEVQIGDTKAAVRDLPFAEFRN